MFETMFKEPLEVPAQDPNLNLLTPRRYFLELCRRAAQRPPGSMFADWPRVQQHLAVLAGL